MHYRRNPHPDYRNPLPYRGCVGVGVVLEEQLADLDVAAVRRLHQRRQTGLQSDAIRLP